MSETADQPYLFSDRTWPHEWMGVFLDALSKMPVVTLACEMANISRPRVYQAREESPEFDEAWREAFEERAPDRVEGIALRWATEGMPIRTVRSKVVIDANGERTVIEETIEESLAVSPALMKFILPRFKPEYQPSERPQRHLHAVGGTGTPIEHEVRHTIRRVPSDERVIELARLYAEFGPPELPPAELPLGELPVIEHEPTE